MPSSLAVRAIACALVFQVAKSSASIPQCKRFDEIYSDGKGLCEQMWDGAFAYESDETKAYTMWFFEKDNPNDAVSRNLGKLREGDHEVCHLNYFHKDEPGPEPDAFTECHPWKDNACCTHGTVETHLKLKESYGKEYHWDRCGPLSPECERFFVQEACFYECDPNAGLYRKYAPSIFNESDPDHNEWQMHGMPIKASYCDAWFTACRKDKFCASSGGSFFSCAAEYKEVDKVAELQAQLDIANALEMNRSESDEGADIGLVVGLIAGSVVILALLSCGCIIIAKERAGKPLFGKLIEDHGRVGANDGQVVGHGNI